MAKANLTPKQLRILEYIRSFRKENGYSPSQQEIAHNFGFKSLGTVQNYLVRLKRQGALSQSWNAKRDLTPLISNPINPIHSETVPLPLLGKIAAGKPLEVISPTDAPAETLEVPTSLFSGSFRSPHTTSSPAFEHYALHVQGSSMIEDGILDGDFVIIRKQSVAQNGETVVALINNEATIKRYYKKTDKKNISIELRPANESYQSLFLHYPAPQQNKIKKNFSHYTADQDNSEQFDEDAPPIDFKIQGILIGLVRRYF